MPKITLFLVMLTLCTFFSVNGQSGLEIKVLHNSDSYAANKQHSIALEIFNNSNEVVIPEFAVEFPASWKILSKTQLDTLQPYSKKLALLSFYIPSAQAANMEYAIVELKNSITQTVVTKNIEFNIQRTYALEFDLLDAPTYIQAGDVFIAKYMVQNNGNVPEKLEFSSKNTKIISEEVKVLQPDSSYIIEIEYKAPNDKDFIYNLSSDLWMKSIDRDTIFKNYNTVKVFPTKIKKKDAYLRFPITASVLLNSYSSERTKNFTSASFELAGQGYIDKDEDHYLNFFFKAPNQIENPRFNQYDRYSVEYVLKDNLKITAGDYNLHVNQLALNGRYGRGLRADYTVKQFDLSAFFIKPRFYINNKSFYGVKAAYNVTDSLRFGISALRTENDLIQNSPFLNIQDSIKEKGQVITLEGEYLSKKTRLRAEVSMSFTNLHRDFANYFTVQHRFSKLYYSGNVVLSGQDYFGSLTNSVQVYNNLNYTFNKKWSIQVGQNLFKVNNRLDEIEYTVQPHSESYYLYSRYRINKAHSLDLRLNHNIREDKTEPKNYDYKEYNMRLGYRFYKNNFSLNYYVNLGTTRNYLNVVDNDYRRNFSQNLNSTVKINDFFKIRGSINHMYTNRYVNTNEIVNYIRYGGGVDIKANTIFRFSFNYTSGFSPEETYRGRDFLNASVFATFNKRHFLEIRANYYSEPGVEDTKELYSQAKYTYKFGVPVKRILDQGAIFGTITSIDSTVVNGITISAAGNTLKSDVNGNFEINNLNIGKNYLLVDSNSLPDGYLINTKMPIEINIKQNQNTALNLELKRASTIKGNITAINTAPDDLALDLTGFFKLENEEFTYYGTSNSLGEFNFGPIVPGKYNLSLLKLKNEESLFENFSEMIVNLEEGKDLPLNFQIAKKRRKVIFTNKNFKVKL